MVKTPISPAQKVSKLENIKEHSNFLREPLASELLEDTNRFSQDAIQILKFHGSYQQYNRDKRAKGQEKDYRMMLRTRNPGGFISAQLYSTIDGLSDEYGNNTLRVTTRQGLQIHGILKKNLKASISAIVKSMGSTLGACGDINRNVMAPPAPLKNRPDYGYAWEYADKIADLLRPQSNAYYEIWLDGEKAISVEEDPEVTAARQRNINGTNFEEGEEPLYGQHYMPRKFKCSVTVPGDNSIDLYTHDVSLVVITDDSGELLGFNVLTGGGMGRTHNREETFPRLADPLGYVAKEDVFDLMKAILATQRDYGDRVQRRHARMKYLIEDWGIDKFRSQVEEYLGKALEPFKPLPPWEYKDFLGWHEQGDGKLFLGISIENGRIQDQGDFRLKSALQKITKEYSLPMRLTANHNLIFYEINPIDQADIESILLHCGIVSDPEKIDSLTRYSMACPALPTCGLAVTESERALPGILERINNVLARVGLAGEEIVIRMTGCPNGCARPYMAELGFVGSAPESYQVWLGGDANQTQLAQPYIDKLPDKDIESFLEPLFAYFKQDKTKQETFGQFCQRVGFEALRTFSENYTPPKPRRVRKNQHRVSVQDAMFARLKQASQDEKRPMNQIVQQALEAYFAEE
ncbi:sulfite reductase, ferredoxin dependent [Crocosphaera watsonii WH 8501]|uniref:Sulfite reductase [ferredoxin] n=5 Tax=Crocosphaera watsonii TaxID=263511 RepID=Q4C1N0_CROWT|nr:MULTISPECIES: sulfite reductase, ferredoxin dependent [Crocosphaera]EAM50068.1 Nitrite/sulfite reductase, hemoprotein beta-component, ferrodoxin-like:Nitrite and sulphite reductase 4Fe-4S region [Crocosphaera watsonii WH 8501]EHJ11882.1 Ferredoxin--sulfite reductase [Crocosphaera watsonii WH 0003]MCH2244968.1 sulfite reductase, ferredoxin dependent [Crocosphaera sp.]CCQ49542.1 Ferredoxin--sulfite reductase [Crocosphaera watsonii WH 8502]CCQ59717.1 Ferredoxin--sulfite reductase [Crocosphaera